VPVNNGILKGRENMRRGRGAKLVWQYAVKGDLRDWNVHRDLALDKTARKSAMYVPE
jgi:hypothetical protein